jgi:hypothetical protein
MKKFLLMFVITGNFIVASIFASDSVQSIRENVFLGMHQIKLPDGLTAFGKADAVVGVPFCDFERSPFDDDDLDISPFRRLGDFPQKLKDPTCSESRGWFSLTCSYYSPGEIIAIYKKIADDASRFKIDSLHFFEILLRTGQFNGVEIPGLNPQPKRAALFREIFEWRNGWRANAKHALEAIRIERERLEAIAAEEEAKRKAEAAEEAARIAAIAAAENAKLEMDRKSSETSGVRRRHVPRTQNTGDDDRATVKDPLISRHPRSSY